MSKRVVAPYVFDRLRARASETEREQSRFEGGFAGDGARGAHLRELRVKQSHVPGVRGAQ